MPSIKILRLCLGQNLFLFIIHIQALSDVLCILWTKCVIDILSLLQQCCQASLCPAYNSLTESHGLHDAEVRMQLSQQMWLRRKDESRSYPPNKLACKSNMAQARHHMLKTTAGQDQLCNGKFPSLPDFLHHHLLHHIRLIVKMLPCCSWCFQNHHLPCHAVHPQGCLLRCQLPSQSPASQRLSLQVLSQHLTNELHN